jgi:hypothetical protein
VDIGEKVVFWRFAVFRPRIWRLWPSSEKTAIRPPNVKKLAVELTGSGSPSYGSAGDKIGPERP